MKMFSTMAFVTIAMLTTSTAIAVNQPSIKPGTDTSSAMTKPVQVREVSIDQKLDEQVPLDLKFKNEQGKEVALKDYFGKKPVVLALVYFECPMLCNQVLNGFVASARTLNFSIGKEYEVLTVSFDPKETPELASGKKKSYLQSYRRPGSEKGWHFLTGTQDSIKKLTDSVGFRYTWDAKLEQFAHGAAIMVLTPEGKISRYLYGIEYPGRDLKLALVEASENKIGGPVEQMMLYCFHYDPLTGRYGAATINLIRVLGVLTIGSLAAFMIIMLRREWRQKRLAEGRAA